MAIGPAAATKPTCSDAPFFAHFLKPERVYLALALSFGVAFALLTPIGQVPDEAAHFRRAFELSEGRIIATKQGDYTGDEQPRALNLLEERYRHLFRHYEEKLTAAQILDGAGIRIEPDDRTFTPFSNTAIHPPLPYLPQAVAIFLAREMSGSVLVCWYAGRAANLVAAVVLTFLAIRLAPAGKWFFVAVALSPMAMSLTASLSSDALTNAFSFLFIAYALAMALGPEPRMSGRSIATMALLGVAVGLSKQAYFFLSLCFLLIPPAKLGSRTRYWTGLAIVLATTTLAVATWAGIVREIYSKADPQFGMNPAEQFRGMLERPLGFLLVLLRTSGLTRILVEEFVGWLGLTDIRLGGWVYCLDVAVLLAAAVMEFGPRSGISMRQAFVAAGIAVLVALSIAVIVHITWDAVGAVIISLKGRYFIPIAPLVGLAVGRFLGGLVTRLPWLAWRIVPAIVAVVVPVVLGAGLATVFERYFVDSPKAASLRSYARGLEFERAGQEKPAREHYEEAIRLYPANSPALLQLACLLARQGEYAEAIGLFDETLKINPADAIAKSRLATVLAAQQAKEQILTEVPRTLQALAASTGLAEERYRDTPEAGIFLKPSRRRIESAPGQAPLPVEFFWRCPAPAGGEIRLSEPRRATDANHASPFYACSAAPLIGPNRLFVFPPPVNAVFLKDEEVSWFYQRPLVDLSFREREREEDYRRQHHLQFPLAKLPD